MSCVSGRQSGLLTRAREERQFSENGGRLGIRVLVGGELSKRRPDSSRGARVVRSDTQASLRDQDQPETPPICYRISCGSMPLMSPGNGDISKRSSLVNGDLNWVTNFIWGIADDVLRDLYVRGKYRDVILPMTVLRRLDAVLELTKKAVLETKANLDNARIMNQEAALRAAAGQGFYNASKFTLRDLRNRGSQQQLRADFEAYLDGFSLNVQEILENFEFRNQIPRLSKADALGTLIVKFLDPGLNFSPNPILNADGSVKHKGLDNHAMGTIFEELVRRFNEENNEEAGEHWTPRDAVKLMANLLFVPIADQIEWEPTFSTTGRSAPAGC